MGMKHRVERTEFARLDSLYTLDDATFTVDIRFELVIGVNHRAPPNHQSTSGVGLREREREKGGMRVSRVIDLSSSILYYDDHSIVGAYSVSARTTTVQLQARKRQRPTILVSSTCTPFCAQS